MAVQQARKDRGLAGIYVQREYYEKLLQFGAQLLQPGDIAVDGGANQGIFTCAFASAVKEEGKVYAFEPLSYAVACLHTNVRLNGFRNVIIHEAALSDRSGRAFIRTGAGAVSASLVRSFNNPEQHEVQTLALDDLRKENRLPKVNFIKLDIEGAESRALKGASELLQVDRPSLCVEAGDSEDFNVVLGIVKPMGYRPFFFDDTGELQAFDHFRQTDNVLFLRQ
jgi:FkbM family methyltransferase